MPLLIITGNFLSLVYVRHTAILLFYLLAFGFKSNGCNNNNKQTIVSLLVILFI